MKRNAFKMKLTSGNVDEYKKRHDDIPENWPELVKAHSDAGISDYSIYYDEETKTLFAFQKLTDDETTADLPNDPIIKKWWAYMNDGIMEYNEKDQPVVAPLEEVFHMD